MVDKLLTFLAAWVHGLPFERSFYYSIPASIINILFFLKKKEDNKHFKFSAPQKVMSNIQCSSIFANAYSSKIEFRHEKKRRSDCKIRSENK